MDTVYKVVRKDPKGRKYSVWMVEEGLVLWYSTKWVTVPKIGKILAFKEKDLAVKFLEGLITSLLNLGVARTEIWTARASHTERPPEHMRETFRGFRDIPYETCSLLWDYWLEGKAPGDWKLTLPSNGTPTGTILCDDLRLVKKVYP